MVNVGLFLVINAVRLILFVGTGGSSTNLYNEVVHALSISTEPWRMLALPWTWITHMFLHEGFWHILWNMLILYWFGRIIGDFIGDRRVLPIYLLSGLMGAVFFIVSFYLLPKAEIPPFALGASAAALGIVMATATVSPNYEMRLILLGPVKIKWIAAFVIVFNLIQVSTIVSTGSSMGHLGGILGGFLCVRGLSSGTNWVDGLAELLDKWNTKLFNRRSAPISRPSGLQVVHKQKSASARKNAGTSIVTAADRVDELLDKIRATGYDSLTKKEKEELRKASDS